MAKRGRPKGIPMTPEQRARVSAAMRRSWEDRRPWLEVSREIQAAMAIGDKQRASVLLNEFMEFEFRFPFDEPDRPIDPEKTKNSEAARRHITRVINSQDLVDEFKEHLAVEAAGIDALFEEGRRLRTQAKAEGRLRMPLTDEEIAAFVAGVEEGLREQE